MKNISIDIETFSDIDLNKCGVYKYAESPNFEILLFGYAVDGGKVQVIDRLLIQPAVIKLRCRTGSCGTGRV